MKRKRPLLIYALIGAISILLVLRNDIAEESFQRTARTCIESLVPSLFPFMIAADLLCKTGESGRGAIVVQLFLGWLFGFPICAKAGSQMYAEGKISYPVFRMMICCGSIPSLPFTLGVCGDMFGKLGGVVLYMIVLSSAVLCIPFFDVNVKPKAQTEALSQCSSLSLGEEISSAISTCTSRMLSICGYVCFFSLLCDVLSAGLDNPLCKCILGGLFEFSGGVVRCGSLGGEVGFIMCAAILSFSGLSVYMQILSVQRSASVSVSQNDYLRYKSIQALFSAVTSAGYVFRENIFGKAILCFSTGIFLCQFFRILQLIYRKSLKREKSNNIINTTY